MKIKLMLAVNDYKNGLHTGEVNQVQIDDLISIEGPPVSCSSNGHKLELDRLYYNLKGYQTWAGNWCWDFAILESIHVARILNHLRDLGWSCFEAEASLFKKWETGQTILPSDLDVLLKEEPCPT
jgi:hypothetical protein